MAYKVKDLIEKLGNFDGEQELNLFTDGCQVSGEEIEIYETDGVVIVSDGTFDYYHKTGIRT